MSLAIHIPPGRPRRIAILIAMLWLLGAVDLAMTLWASRLDCFREVNPLANHLLHWGWIPSVILLKLASIGTGSIIFWRLRHMRQSELALCGLILVHIVLVVRWSQFARAAMSRYENVPVAAYASTDQ